MFYLALFSVAGRNACPSRKARWIAILLMFGAGIALSGCHGGTGSVTPQPAPTITSLSPATATAGSSSLTLTIHGANYVTGSMATFNSASKPTTYFSSTQLTIPLNAADLASPGAFSVVVTNPGSGSSNPATFAVSSPPPVITGLSPSSVTAGVTAQKLIIKGTDFVSGATVMYNGIARPSTYVNASRLSVELTSEDLATAGQWPVVVVNPSGGGSSNMVYFGIKDAVPHIADAVAVVASRSQSSLDLLQGWRLQSSEQVSRSGDVISTPGFQADTWYAVDIPATAAAGLLKNGVYGDPFPAQNFLAIQNTDADFAVPWWYRKEFTIPAGAAGKRIWLNFQGINYRANIWLNGTRIADSNTVAGTFRQYEFDITSQVKVGGGQNALALEIFRPVHPSDPGGDLAMTAVDWNPQPPDLSMGLLNDVFVAISGPVAVRSPLVTSRFDLPALDVAHLSVSAELKNQSDTAQRGVIEGTIGTVTFSQEVRMAAGEVRAIGFSSDDFPQLNFAQPRLWWPWQYGEPFLHTLQIEFKIDGVVSDQLQTRFGIRQITSALDNAGHAVFGVNGQPLLIRGAAWAPDLFQRRSTERQEAEFRYIRDLNLNAIRLEGKFEDDHFFDLADQNGLLILVGWCCCDSWQMTESWTAEMTTIANQSLISQMRRLRNHPSMMLWTNGSDQPPSVPAVERDFLQIESALQWPNPIASHAAGFPSEVSGPTGLKMAGPYDWVPPLYWEADTERGGAFGFATEIGPGPSPPPIESLMQMLTAGHLWPMDDTWNYHAALNMFNNLDIFTDALNHRYGAPASAADYARKAQAMAYESNRAMFEAYGRNKYTSATGVIKWMLNNGWPSMFWNLYDYYLRPGGAYFGAKKALEPLHIQYSYKDHAVVVVNSFNRDYSGLQAAADIYDRNGGLVGSSSAQAAIAADGVTTVFTLSQLRDLLGVHFLRLTLTDANRQLVSTNTYWLTNPADALDWQHWVWYYTPQSVFADFTALQSLPKTTLVVTDQIANTAGGENIHNLTITNSSPGIVFQVRMRIRKGQGGDEVLPVIWEDNYFVLLPGETRQITATYRRSDLGNASPLIEAEAWNQ